MHTDGHPNRHAHAKGNGEREHDRAEHWDAYIYSIAVSYADAHGYAHITPTVVGQYRNPDTDCQQYRDSRAYAYSYAHAIHTSYDSCICGR